MSKISPTQRALKLLRSRGWQVAITEKWNMFAKVRQDVFGFGDLLAMDPYTKQILLVQVTSGSNHAARRSKIQNIEAAKEWILCGGLILLMSFRKSAKGKWEAREEFVSV